MTATRATRLMAAMIALAAASAPGLALSQGAPLRPAADTPGQAKLSDQVLALDAKLAARIKANRISPVNADLIQRELNDVQARIAADRDAHGGQLTVAERLRQQAQIDKIADEIRKATLVTGAPPAH